jgi:branched-chain amino acid transport system ATP-binding protein
MSVLEVRDVALAFGGLVALDGVSVEVRRQEIHGIIGPNGAGKTSALDVITGVYRPTNGSVMLDGEDITHWAAHRRARAGLGRSFQTVGLAPGLTSRDNVLATIEALERVWFPFPRPKATGRRRAEADELLAFFGLEEAADIQVTELPLGTTKLLELAKVFAGAPKVVLLDEPFAGLSSVEGAERVKLISERRRLTNTGVVIVEHDVPLLLATCDTVTVLDAGHVVATGEPEVVMADQAVRDAYMGDVTKEIAA